MKTRIVILSLAMVSAFVMNVNAQIVLSNHLESSGSNPYLPSTDAANYILGMEVVDARFGLDAVPQEAAEQTFTLASALNLNSIFFAYNEMRTTGSIRVDLDYGNDGGVDYTDDVTITGLDIGAGTTTGPVHWLQLDFSADSLTLPTGLNSITLTGLTEDSGTSFMFAPMYNTDVNSYTDGAMTLDFSSTQGDMGFGITGTAVPEPSSILIVGLGGTVVLLRRRKKLSA